MSTDNPTTESNNHRALDSLKRIVQARVDGRMNDAEWDEFMGVIDQILTRVNRDGSVNDESRAEFMGAAAQIQARVERDARPA